MYNNKKLLKKEAPAKDSSLFFLLGIIFFLITCILIVKEYKEILGLVLGIMTLVFGILSQRELKFNLNIISSYLFLIMGLISSLIFAYKCFEVKSCDLSFLISVGIIFIFSVVIIITKNKDWLSDISYPTIPEAWTYWFGAILGGGFLSWALYYKFLSLGHEDFIIRRLIITIFWVIIGGILYILGRPKKDFYLSLGGGLFILLGIVKAIIYDMTKLSGGIRILVFAIISCILLGFSFFLKTKKVEENK